MWLSATLAWLLHTQSYSGSYIWNNLWIEWFDTYVLTDPSIKVRQMSPSKQWLSSRSPLMLTGEQPTMIMCCVHDLTSIVSDSLSISKSFLKVVLNGKSPSMEVFHVAPSLAPIYSSCSSMTSPRAFPTLLTSNLMQYSWKEFEWGKMVHK